MSVVRGRPPGLAGGIRGASRAYCSSLSACPAPKSPTKARFSAVHMACLQEGLLPSLNRRHGHYASSSLSTARTSQTASEYPGLFGRFCLLRSRKPITQRLRGLELHPVAGGNLDFLTGARVAALAGFGPFALEAAQPAYVRLALGSDRAGDLVDQAIIGRFGRAFRASGSICNGGDQVALGHQDNSFLIGTVNLPGHCGEGCRSRWRP